MFEEDPEARFAATMKQAREELGWSQGALAKELVAAGLEGFHQTTVSRIEKLERPVRLAEALTIASVFHRDVQSMTSYTVQLQPELRGVSDDYRDFLMSRTRLELALSRLARAADELESPTEDTTQGVLMWLTGATPMKGAASGGHEPQALDQLGFFERTLEEALQGDQERWRGTSGDD